MYSKRSQIDMMETIMVSVVVIILIIVALVFYFKFYSGEVEETRGEISLRQASVMLTTLTSMPELQCSARTVDKDCIDVVKLYNFKALVMENKAYYSDMFGWKKIIVEQMYPVVDVAECSLGSYQDITYPNNCNQWLLYNNPKQNYKAREIVSTPVSLFFPNINRYSVGKLSIEVYR